MKIAELRGKTEDELKTLLANLKKEAFNLRFQKVSGELSNTARVREVRRAVAKIYTLLNDEGAKQGKVAKAAKPKAAKKEPKKAAEKKETAKKPAEKKTAEKKKAPAKKAAAKK